MRSLALALLVSACCARIDVNAEPDASLRDPDANELDAGEPTDAGPCNCVYFEHTPSPTAVYVGPCGEYGLWDESAIVAPNNIFICSDMP
jgi:hypothetical protein